MGTVLETLGKGDRVAVVRLRSLGDCVLTTPAIELLKNHRPDLRVAVVVEDRFAPVFEGNADVDEILPPSVRKIRDWKPGLCLNLHGGNTSATLTALSGARIRAGFDYFVHPFVYTITIPRAQTIYQIGRKVHTVEHLASAVFFLGVPFTEIPRTKLSAPPPRPAAPYAVIHPAASEIAKTWPASKFLEIAQHLKNDGLEPIFVGGPGENLSAFSAYRTLTGAPLASLKSLLSGADLFVGNDSGPAHMAAALGVPVVAIFGKSDPEIWGPWRSPSAVLNGAHGIDSVTAAAVLAVLPSLRVRENA